MHIPVLLAGFFCGPLPAALAGLVTPLLSTLLTGMPPLAPIPVALAMSLELSSAAWLIARLSSGTAIHPAGILLAGMICGRLVSALFYWTLVLLAGYELAPWSMLMAAILTGLPGIILQFLFLPALVNKLRLARGGNGENG